MTTEEIVNSARDVSSDDDPKEEGSVSLNTEESISHWDVLVHKSPHLYWCFVKWKVLRRKPSVCHASE
ncbi:hypothetical protein HPB50_011732 [Hyalomma asiaticum]|uniref:Uncharacterized protein n=1 Tax=Hyalomma asiaticum TaxID=266040 RepID=A0ACB7SG54_HYAAI|nr:hypothetical protein HPB50_011732 [Hyalomma asiaticum]